MLTTGDFLATWAVELAVHHLDLNAELAIAPPAAPALRLARSTIEALVDGDVPPSWSDETVVLLGAGRVAVDAASPLAGELPVLG